MQAHFINTPNGFGFRFPDFVVPDYVIEVPFTRATLTRLRTELIDFSGKTVNVRVWNSSGRPGSVMFVDYNWVKIIHNPLVRLIEPKHGLSFHYLLDELTLPISEQYLPPAPNEPQIELVLLK